MLLNDRQIAKYASKGMIVPFTSEQVRLSRITSPDLQQDTEFKCISYGLSSYGYDVRLASKEFLISRHIPGTVIDPKKFNPDNLEPAKLHEDESGLFFILPSHSYGLGFSFEHFRIPRSVTAVALGKSTYARIGVIANTTPIEAGWQGYITLEFSNSSDGDVRIYALEGVIQLLFFEGEPCQTSYADRNGKYQDQGAHVVTAKV